MRDSVARNPLDFPAFGTQDLVHAAHTRPHLSPAAAHSTMADDDASNTTTTTGGGIIFDTYTDWWVFLTITVVCWSVVYGVVSKSMRDVAERERAA